MPVRFAHMRRASCAAPLAALSCRRALGSPGRMPDAPDRLLEEGGLPQPPKGWRMTADLSRALLVTARPDEGFARLLLEQGGDAATRKLPELSVAVTMTASNRRPANPQRREAAFDKSLRRRGRPGGAPPAAAQQPWQPVLRSCVRAHQVRTPARAHRCPAAVRRDHGLHARERLRCGACGMRERAR